MTAIRSWWDEKTGVDPIRTPNLKTNRDPDFFPSTEETSNNPGCAAFLLGWKYLTDRAQALPPALTDKRATHRQEIGRARGCTDFASSDILLTADHNCFRFAGHTYLYHFARQNFPFFQIRTQTISIAPRSGNRL